jgi:hypothetical protein
MIEIRKYQNYAPQTVHFQHLKYFSIVLICFYFILEKHFSFLLVFRYWSGLFSFPVCKWMESKESTNGRYYYLPSNYLILLGSSLYLLICKSMVLQWMGTIKAFGSFESNQCFLLQTIWNNYRRTSCFFKKIH